MKVVSTIQAAFDLKRTERRSTCWVSSAGIALPKPHHGHSRSSSCIQYRARKLLKRTAKPSVVLMSASQEDKDSGGEDEKDNPQDWDSSWKDFEERRASSSGVFKLPPEDFQQKQVDYESKQVQRLTSAWSNDKGFLVGIGIIGLIGLFYGYVFLTGGISHS